MSIQNQPKEPNRSNSVTFKQLYNHFFLLHDFFHRMTKTKGTNAAFFDLQIDVHNGMKNAVDAGAKAFQAIAFASLCTYFFKGNSIRLRFVYGFFFMYWYNHLITLGSYAGAFTRLPSMYKKASIYYHEHPEERNLIERLNVYLNKQQYYQEPQLILSQIYGADIEQKSFVANDFFVKNKEKYLPKEVLEYHTTHDKKLKYGDSFLTRYVYYSFARWLTRVSQFLSFQSQDD